ncbi:hypothetical protein [Nitrospira calida]
MQVIAVVEKTDVEYVASSDELRATASGATEEEALTNLKTAIRELLALYEPEVRRVLERRKAVTMEV